MVSRSGGDRSKLTNYQMLRGREIDNAQPNAIVDRLDHRESMGTEHLTRIDAASGKPANCWVLLETLILYMVRSSSALAEQDPALGARRSTQALGAGGRMWTRLSVLNGKTPAMRGKPGWEALSN